MFYYRYVGRYEVIDDKAILLLIIPIHTSNKLYLRRYIALVLSCCLEPPDGFEFPTRLNPKRETCNPKP